MESPLKQFGALLANCVVVANVTYWTPLSFAGLLLVLGGSAWDFRLGWRPDDPPLA